MVLPAQPTNSRAETDKKTTSNESGFCLIAIKALLIIFQIPGHYLYLFDFPFGPRAFYSGMID